MSLILQWKVRISIKFCKKIPEIKNEINPTKKLKTLQYLSKLNFIFKKECRAFDSSNVNDAKWQQSELKTEKKKLISKN